MVEKGSVKQGDLPNEDITLGLGDRPLFYYLMRIATEYGEELDG